MDLVRFFIEKGVKDWNVGLYNAVEGGHIDLVRFFIEKGADDCNYAMRIAKLRGHMDLIKVLKKHVY
jgi:ankyrin repeat protein